MKKYIAVLLSLLMLLAFAASASAATLLEWNWQCRSKLGRETTLYDCYFNDEDEAATPTDMSYTFEPIGVLAGGSYIKLQDASIAGKREIAYWTTGGVQYAWVDASACVSATVTVTGTDGKTYTIPEACWGDAEAIRYTLGSKYSADELHAIIHGSLSGAGGSTGGSGKAAAPTEWLTFTRVGEDGKEETVAVERLGLVYTTIRVGRETERIPTAELSWEADADEAHAMAVISAPKSGKITLYNKASTRGKSLGKCKTNRIVAVLSTGKNYTKICYDGMVGYVVTSALDFYPVGGVRAAKKGQTEPEVAKDGWISFRGKLKSKNTINVRMNGKNGSRILGDYIAGTPIAIFNQDSKWTEIEVDGYRCFILTEYVTLDEGDGEDE